MYPQGQSIYFPVTYFKSSISIIVHLQISYYLHMFQYSLLKLVFKIGYYYDFCCKLILRIVRVFPLRLRPFEVLFTTDGSNRDFTIDSRQSLQVLHLHRSNQISYNKGITVVLNNHTTIKSRKMATIVIRKFYLRSFGTLISTSLKVFGTMQKKVYTLVTDFYL